MSLLKLVAVNTLFKIIIRLLVYIFNEFYKTNNTTLWCV